ncbi:MAG: hypothetical protein F9K44_08525, partial [Hyphomicrobiaceae bacterium]
MALTGHCTELSAKKALNAMSRTPREEDADWGAYQTLSLWNRHPAGRLVLMCLMGACIGTAGVAFEAKADWRDKFFGRTTQPQNYTRELTAREKALKQPEAAAAELQNDDLPLSDDATLQGLEAAIQRYQQIAASGGWPQVRAGKHIRPDEEDERVPVLRRRLRISGDYQPRQPGREGSIVFDAELEEAVRRFQSRHGVRPSGIVDRPTFDALNVPADVRVAQLKVNVIRIRELLTQTASAERYVLV